MGSPVPTLQESKKKKKNHFSSEIIYNYKETLTFEIASYHLIWYNYKCSKGLLSFDFNCNTH